MLPVPGAAPSTPQGRPGVCATCAASSGCGGARGRGGGAACPEATLPPAAPGCTERVGAAETEQGMTGVLNIGGSNINPDCREAQGSCPGKVEAACVPHRSRTAVTALSPPPNRASASSTRPRRLAMFLLAAWSGSCETPVPTGGQTVPSLGRVDMVSGPLGLAPPPCLRKQSICPSSSYAKLRTRKMQDARKESDRTSRPEGNGCTMWGFQSLQQSVELPDAQFLNCLRHVANKCITASHLQ